MPTNWNSPFAQDMQACLSGRPRSIAPKYFYDAEGSRLFDLICELPEYYPTRTEVQILQRHASDIATLMGPGADLIEFGAGSLTKVRILLDAMAAPLRYVPIDISREHLQAAARELQGLYPRLAVQPLVADYGQPFEVPTLAGAGTGQARRVGFFPGSTIGNYTPEEAVVFFRMAARVLQGGALLIGADLIKDPAVLHAAYSDAQGVTAAFNLNLWARANRELGADFDLAQWAHSAFYNAPLQRIEMHLMSRCRQTVHLNGQAHEFAEGETVHTENSCKFTVDGLRALAAQAGFSAGPVWLDDQRRFSLHWLQAPAA
ncbi:MAG: L-histidine N(alpha)-methyltransferase [Pseudomonadota bacterium]|jgi:dimethylhistidine N-methyltransferase